MAKLKVNKTDPTSAVTYVLDSNVSVVLNKLDGAYHALVTEVYEADSPGIQGVILYVPGVTYKLLCGK